MRTGQHLLICGRTSGVCLPPSLTPSTSPQTACTPSSSRAMPECLALKRVLEFEFGLRDLLSRRQGCWLGKQHEARGQRHPQVHFYLTRKALEPCHLISSPWLGLNRISYSCMKVRILSLDVKLLMSLSTFLFLLQKTLPVGTLHTVLCTPNTILDHALPSTKYQW